MVVWLIEPILTRYQVSLFQSLFLREVLGGVYHRNGLNIWISRILGVLCDSFWSIEPDIEDWDHIYTWRFCIVPKRNEAILLARNDVSQKIDQ